MYRYEVTSSVRSDIEGVVGRPIFYKDGTNYYIDGVNKDNSFQYYESSSDSIVSKTLDDICQALYTLDFEDKSTEEEYVAEEYFRLSDAEKKGSQKLLTVATRRPEGSSATKVTHDFTDKTTWYEGSTEVTGETMTDSGDGLKFNSANAFWINLTNGLVYGEDDLANKREPAVYVGGVEQTTGFTVDYRAGDVTFDTAPVGTVTCDYWYAGSSCFTLAPESGKALLLEHAELQFTKDVELTDAVMFEIWVYNPYDLPNKIMYQRVKYKNFRDVINSANLGTGTIPAVGDFTNEICVFPFNYVTIKALLHSQGAELRVCTENDGELTGEWGTATFYIMSEDE